MSRPPYPSRASNPSLEARWQQALTLHGQGQLRAAQAIYEDILRLQPDHVDALHLLGVAAGQTGNAQRSVELISRAVELRPDDAALHANLGNAWFGLRQFEAAVASHERALRLQPDLVDAHSNKGNALVELRQFDAAIAAYDRAISLAPGHAHAHGNRGIAQLELRRFGAAVDSLKRAIGLQPDYGQAWLGLGRALQECRQVSAAVDCYVQAIRRRPDYAEAYCNLGVALAELEQFDAALAAYAKALEIRPDYVRVHINRANLFKGRAQFEAALQSFDEALARSPGHEFLGGDRAFVRMSLCDWQGLADEIRQLEQRAARGEKAMHPFAALSLTESAGLQQQVARTWAEEHFGAHGRSPQLQARAGRDKIRLGYFSPDLRDHAVAYLTAELFENHDRDRFEVIAFAYGPDPRDAMQERLAKAFDRVIDVRALGDEDVARTAREMRIDIAIDLAGYTAHSRTDIFAHRAAPIQVSYIGYPGTMGAPFIDYLIADRVLIPDACQAFYTEKIAYLPSFQVNDSRREPSDQVPRRSDLGLPDDAFVFCCFNNNYKITPTVFDRWMRILRATPGSVLFLYTDSAQVQSRLGDAAQAHGVAAARLIFGRRLPRAEYLARYRCADLFLDTAPYNAGATASDALWMGLPVLSLPGETFASRMGASLLTAVGLPELIAPTASSYEELAIALARDPVRLAQIRQRLAEQRGHSALFDASRFTRRLEAVYLAMQQRRDAGLPADHIDLGAGG